MVTCRSFLAAGAALSISLPLTARRFAVAQAAADYQTTSPDPERWDEFLTNISNMWATEPNWTMDQIAAIETPFLVLDGEDEEVIDIDHVRLLAELLPNGTLLLMPGTGHFAMYDQPEKFTRIVADYLDPPA
jgi:pimeloyl-ACP methyl ester carboxylesterase